MFEVLVAAEHGFPLLAITGKELFGAAGAQLVRSLGGVGTCG